MPTFQERKGISPNISEIFNVNLSQISSHATFILTNISLSIHKILLQSTITM